MKAAVRGWVSEIASEPDAEGQAETQEQEDAAADGQPSEPLSPVPTEWGGYSAEETFDRESDGPEMTLGEIVALEPGYKLVRLQDFTNEEGQDFNDAMLARLVDAPVVQSAEYLDIGRNFGRLTGAGVAEIIRSGKLAHLRFLSIDNCYSLDDEPVLALAEGHVPNLEGLALGSTEITDRALTALAETDELPKLGAVVGLFIPNVTAEGVSKLRAARPNLAVRITIG
jgi:hypothetical protein